LKIPLYSHRDIQRQYPSIIDCTTIDWILDCPEQSLMEVAERFLETVDILETNVLEVQVTFSLLMYQKGPKYHIFINKIVDSSVHCLES
jgi:hypothetical protein